MCARSRSVNFIGPEEEEIWERGVKEAASSRMTLGTDMSDSSALSEDVDIDVVGGDISVGKDGKYIHHEFNLDNDSDDNYSQNAAERASSPGLSSSDCPSDQMGSNAEAGTVIGDKSRKKCTCKATLLLHRPDHHGHPAEPQEAPHTQ